MSLHIFRKAGYCFRFAVIASNETPNYELIEFDARHAKDSKHTRTYIRDAEQHFQYQEIIQDPNIDLVMICTRHNLHGKMVLESLNAGKHTFVEKPLCMDLRQARHIRSLLQEHPQVRLSSNLILRCSCFAVQGRSSRAIICSSRYGAPGTPP